MRQLYQYISGLNIGYTALALFLLVVAIGVSVKLFRRVGLVPIALGFAALAAMWFLGAGAVNAITHRRANGAGRHAFRPAGGDLR